MRGVNLNPQDGELPPPPRASRAGQADAPPPARPAPLWEDDPTAVLRRFVGAGTPDPAVHRNIPIIPIVVMLIVVGLLIFVTAPRLPTLPPATPASSMGGAP